MTDRLKAWCHWKSKENHVSDEDMLMVRDIEALLEENAKLRAVVEAAKSMGNHTFVCEAIIMEPPGACDCGFDNIRDVLQRLETTNG